MRIRDLPVGRLRVPDPRDDPALTLVWCAMALHIAYLSWVSLGRHNNFWTGRYDLGNMVQAVWSTANGRPLESTAASGEQFVRLGAHVDPILILFAPLWSLIPRPEMLLVVQAVALAAGALPVFWLGRRWLGSDGLALAGVAVYLLYPPLLWSQVTEFHPVVLATPLLLFAIWAIEEDRPTALVISVGLALLCKEHVGLAVACLGLWAAVAHGRRLWGALLAATGVAWTAFALLVVIPAFAPSGGGNPFAGRYQHLGDSMGEVVRSVLTRPGLVADTVFTEPKLLFLGAVLAPLMFLPLAAPLLALGAVPELAMNVLTNYWPQYTAEFQYTAVATPFLVAAALRGLAHIRDDLTPPRWLDPPAVVWAVAMVVTVLIAGWRSGPLPLWYHVPGGSETRRWEFTPDPHTQAMQQGVDVIPSGASVSVANAFGSRLSARRRVYSFPRIQDAQWVIVDEKRPSLADQAVSWRRFAPYLALLQANPRYRQVFARDGVRVFRRVAPPRITVRVER